MLFAITNIIIGLVLIGFAADRFIDGAVGLARHYGLPSLIIGLTIVAFGTSVPEFFVSMTAALNGSSSLAIGNVIGSNIANIGLVLGITALLFPISVNSNILKRELPLLFFIMLIAAALFLNHHWGRLDGIIMILLMFAVMGWMIQLAKKNKAQDALAKEYEQEFTKDKKQKTLSISMSILWLVIGLILLPIASDRIVVGATRLATLLGISDLFIGLTVVAIGTSLPEIATSIAAAMKKEHDMIIGNVIGSNLFNLMPVLGIAGVIHPSYVSSYVLYRDLPYMFFITLLFTLFIYSIGKKLYLGRVKALILLASYFAYIALISLPLIQ